VLANKPTSTRLIAQIVIADGERLETDILSLRSRLCVLVLWSNSFRKRDRLILCCLLGVSMGCVPSSHSLDVQLLAVSILAEGAISCSLLVCQRMLVLLQQRPRLRVRYQIEMCVVATCRLK
jgi:hypothetical protein